EVDARGETRVDLSQPSIAVAVEQVHSGVDLVVESLIEYTHPVRAPGRQALDGEMLGGQGRWGGARRGAEAEAQRGCEPERRRSHRSPPERPLGIAPRARFEACCRGDGSCRESRTSRRAGKGRAPGARAALPGLTGRRACRRVGRARTITSNRLSIARHACRAAAIAV